MKVLSIDIGVRNFAMSIENFDEKKIETFSKEFKMNFKTNISKCNSNNEPTEKYSDFLKRFITECSSTEICSKIDFCDDDEKKPKRNKRNQVILDNNIFYSIIKKLDDYKSHFNNVDYVVIERQLKTNPNAQTVEHHVHAYFIHNYGLDKEVVSFESRHKTRVLCCPKKILKEEKMVNIDKAYRKKWTTNKVMNMMIDRKDNSTFDYIFKQNKSKADDISDTICQAIAFALLRFVGA
jgi:hypothetical protein